MNQPFIHEEFTYLSLIVIVGLLVVYFKNYLRSVILAFSLPGPSAIPFFGNVLIALDSNKMEELGTNISQYYGPVVRAWISIFPIFLIYEPTHLQILLGNNKMSEKNIFYKYMHNFIGEGLITNNGRKWKKNRKLIQPYFNIITLKNYFKSFAKWSQVLTDRLRGGSERNIIPTINRIVLEILHDAILGTPLKNNDASPFRKGELLVTDRITRPWLMINSIFKITKAARKELQYKKTLQDFIRKILEEKMQSRKESGAKEVKTSLIDMFIDISMEHPEFTNEDIINETCTFMLAGQDSIGAAVVFTLYNLAKHQKIQEKVFEELKLIFENISNNRCTTFEDLLQMKYLEQCIKETLRLLPSVPLFARKLLQDLDLGKTIIPAGSNIFISPFATHRLPHIYQNPLVYDPDRFSYENNTKLHQYAFIPFSAGARNCIGHKFALFEIKTLISEILRKYHVSLVPGHENFTLNYRVTTKARGGIWIKFTDRQLAND